MDYIKSILSINLSSHPILMKVHFNAENNVTHLFCLDIKPNIFSISPKWLLYCIICIFANVYAFPLFSSFRGCTSYTSFLCVLSISLYHRQY